MKKIKILAYIMALLYFSACSSCPDQYGDDDGEERLYFTLRYEQNTNDWRPVIGAFGYIPEDSVKMYDVNGNLIDDFWIATGGGGNPLFLLLIHLHQEEKIYPIHTFSIYLMKTLIQ